MKAHPHLPSMLTVIAIVGFVLGFSSIILFQSATAPTGYATAPPTSQPSVVESAPDVEQPPAIAAQLATKSKFDIFYIAVAVIFFLLIFSTAHDWHPLDDVRQVPRLKHKVSYKQRQ
ncbi:hypothetical protein HZB02_05925 [Candidatus Woesearchaeota archaeon]|nr:hypothetical protein [Candidatus Woesearchaeota archaeon]